MKRVAMYEAFDGVKFLNRAACIRYEATVGACQKLMRRLPKLPKDPNCKFANGEGWIQHDRKVWDTVWSAFYLLACKLQPSLKRSGYLIGTYGFSRTLDDNGSPLYRYYMRYCNTDKATLREYGQPFFANHPERVTGHQINK